MPRPRSYHQRTPRITAEYSASALSRRGFLPAILGYLRRLGLPERLRGVTIPSAPNAHFQPVDKLMTLVTLLITGIARISHIDSTLAGETALAGLLGLDRLPSPPATPSTPSSARSPPGTSSRWTPSIGSISMNRPASTRGR